MQYLRLFVRKFWLPRAFYLYVLLYNDIWLADYIPETPFEVNI